MPEEKWYSMDIYAAKLMKALTELSLPLAVSTFTVRRPFPALSGKIGQFLTYFWRLTAYPLKARTLKADIYHVVDHSYAHLAYVLDTKKTVITCHDLAPLILRTKQKSGLSDKIWDLSISGLNRAAKIIAISQNTRNDLIKLLNIPERKITTIYYGLDKDFKPLDKEQVLPLRKKLVGETEFVILHVGHCHWRKNVELILKALALLKNRLNFVFLQVGGSWSKKQKELIEQLKLEKYIKQLSYLDSKLLPQVYNFADVFVFPSWYEGFGLPPLEAMGCGLPVIVSQLSSLPEVVGEAGLFVNPNDDLSLAQMLETVLNNKSLQKQLSQKGLERAKLFNWQTTATKTYAVYQDVVG